MKFFILDADYTVEGGKTKIRIWGKDEKGKNGVLFFEEKPYFFVLPKNENEAISDIQKLLTERKIKIEKIEKAKMKLAGEEKDFIKIVCKRPADTQNIRDIIKFWKKREVGKDR
jgi:DNA polymerase elongation subunit (family B)